MITESVFQFIFLPFLFVHLATLMSFNFLEKIIFIGLFEFWLHTSEIRCCISSGINTHNVIKKFNQNYYTYVFLFAIITDRNLDFSYCFHIQLSCKINTSKKVTSWTEHYEQNTIFLRKSWEFIFSLGLMTRWWAKQANLDAMALLTPNPHS